MTLSSIPDSRIILQVWLQDYDEREILIFFLFVCFRGGKKKKKESGQNDSSEETEAIPGDFRRDIKASEGTWAPSDAANTCDVTLGETVQLP